MTKETYVERGIWTAVWPSITATH